MTSLEDALNGDGYLIISARYPYKVGETLKQIFDYQNEKRVRRVRHPFTIIAIPSPEEVIEYCKRHGFPEDLVLGYYHFKVVTD